MRALVQRVRYARVRVDGVVVGEVGTGLLVLVGFAPTDTPELLRWMAHKLVHLRVFPDEAGRMNRSVQDIQGGLLIVSQFTLYGDVRRGFRPSFTGAAPPERAQWLYEEFLRICREHPLPVASGIFGAMMEVELLNDGPVTLWIEREATE
ncbi:MAG: D-aminoacyl-tRNA deacylase [Candidatus Kapabacteria bacterium]|nr:D-aminoacyl-tRNA deacylase [Candidatus Kapabacteria bacterium]MCS7169790.1 D-aminoacyl-tRNA deacylase [Candidatus Kapabacteria bacterium]MDW7996306.1 D-aminoacyl-tRNA deacylase [Bacteroidota bacterium]MDW8225264.1 D-aminoacyl-tRNA deacylase [Bacteroidota bacterium]